MAIAALLAGASSPTYVSIALAASECSRSMELADWGENSTGDISVTSGDSCIFPITLRGAASGSKISQKPAHGKLKKLNVATYEYIALPVGALGVAHKRAQGSLLARGRGGKKVAEKHACMRMRVLLQTLFSQWYPEASPIDVGLKISQIVPS
ncbi:MULTISPECIES: hypothetical protein [Bradyrhizobium]|uniref:hypothetical protein n=1 Tax=Bradyrhizobium TaxID=374 RepID=UPI0018AD3211|nr:MULTISPECIES: hypothetical protein [Bradyrhizobium]MCP1745096.1 hypothetical protein [Bradyrhizobium japonicum]MCP1893582.1 hypothetical protein [Bradyrhizobium japonicum]